MIGILKVLAGFIRWQARKIIHERPMFRRRRSQLTATFGRAQIWPISGGARTNADFDHVHRGLLCHHFGDTRFQARGHQTGLETTTRTGGIVQWGDGSICTCLCRDGSMGEWRRCGIIPTPRDVLEDLSCRFMVLGDGVVGSCLGRRHVDLHAFITCHGDDAPGLQTVITWRSYHSWRRCG